MKKNKTIADLEAENRLLRQSNSSETWASIIKELIRFGTVCFVSYLAYLSIVALAGKTTSADILVNFLGSIKISQGLAYVLAGVGVVYGGRERKLRQKTVERLQTRNQELENKLDPSRTSSKLTRKGETNPEDLS